MTLILCLSPEVYPVLCADALASSPEGKPDFVIPTLGKKAQGFVSKHNLQAHSLVDKVVKLSDYIFVAWAGRSDVVIQLFEELRHRYRGDPLSFDDLFTYVQSRFADMSPKPCLMFLVKCQTGRTGFAEFGCKKRYSPAFGNYWIGGTGSTRAEKIIEQLPAGLPQAENELTQRLNLALLVTGSLLANELATGEPINESFGAAYQIGTFMKAGVATKLDDYVYCFWEGEIDGNNSCQINFPKKIIRKFSATDHSLFYCIEPTWNPEGPKIEKEEVFAVESMYGKRLVHQKLELPNLNARWQINFISLRNEAGSWEFLSLLTYKHNRKHSLMNFLNSKKGIEFKIDFDLMKEILDGRFKRET